MNLRHLVFVALLMAAGAFAFQDGKQSKQRSHGKKPAVKRKKDDAKHPSNRRRSDDPPPVGDPGPWPISPPKTAAGAPLAQNGPKGPWSIRQLPPKPHFSEARFSPEGIVYYVSTTLEFQSAPKKSKRLIILYEQMGQDGKPLDDYTLRGKRFAIQVVRKGQKQIKVSLGVTQQCPTSRDANGFLKISIVEPAATHTDNSFDLGPFGPWPISPPASRANWQHVGADWRLYGEINLTDIFNSPPGGVLFTISPRAVLPVGTSTVLPTPMPPVTFRWTQVGFKQNVLLLTLNTPPTSQDETRMIEY